MDEQKADLEEVEEAHLAELELEVDHVLEVAHLLGHGRAATPQAAHRRLP